MSGKRPQTCGCCGWSKVTTYQGLRIHQGKMGCTPKGTRIPESEQINYFPRISYTPPPIKSVFNTPPLSYQTITSLDRTLQLLDFSAGTLQVDMTLTPEISTIRMTPLSRQTPAEETFFKTPPLSYQTHQTSSDKARRVLDFSTEASQVKQDRTKADLEQKIRTRELKLAEVCSAVQTCQKSLDTELQEIDGVFSEVMKLVEDARQKALQPVRERRKALKSEAQHLVQKLQAEIDRLKDAMDELEDDQDFQVSPLQGLDGKKWEEVSVDSSRSFGTLKAQTSVMIKAIQEKLERLTAVELKRIPTFAVDIKLDAATAHHCLVLSDDGKKVRDGGQKLKVPDGPERFDVFGSVLGLNRLNSGKAYWEVEVSNKTGWDLGVARRSAKRKGMLAVNTDNGYWVTVHYEGQKYAALTVPPVSLPLRQKPLKVGVFVDYEEGLVSFYNVTSRSHIFSFTECSFNDEIVPYFSPHLKQNDKNADPLIISAV